MARLPRFDSPVARLGAYGVLLLVALGGGAALGSVVGSDAQGDGGPAPTHADHSSVPADGREGEAPAGVGLSQDGYQMRLDPATVPARVTAPLSFVIEGPDGMPVQDHDEAHESDDG